MTEAQRRLTAIVEIVICSSLPTQLLLTVGLVALGMRPVGPDGALSLPFLVTLSMLDTILLVGLMVIFTRLHGEAVRELWLGDRPIGKEVLYGLLLIPAAFVMVVVLLNVLRLIAPWLHNVPENPLERLAQTPGGAVAFALVAIVAGGVREELQRAFLLRRFERHLGGATVGVVVLSAAFGLGHIVQGWDAVITTGALGAFWAIVYLRRRSVVAPMVSHSGFNTLEIVRVALGLQ
jgi:uncharacterized protein